MAQVVEYFISKHKTLGSIPSTANKEKKMRLQKWRVKW
jgi:hypothetical protein